MKITTYRLDRGSVILVGGSEPFEDDELARYMAAALECLGVEYVFVPPGVELTILSGPAYPVEITAVASADRRRA